MRNMSEAVTPLMPEEVKDASLWGLLDELGQGETKAGEISRVQ